jgi:hypothetical protein
MTARRIARVATVRWITIFGPALAVTPAALADPTDVVGPQAPGSPVVTESDAVASDAAVTACKQFADAMGAAAANYSDFADVTSGDRWNYGDPVVASANVTGRTALRQAAAAAAEASRTQGLQPEIANPMRWWSLHATKLLVIMGLRGSNNMTGGTANQLNDDASNVQMACVAAGTRA